MYANGQGVARDEATAARLFRKAADAGEVFGMFNLGEMYENGVGVTKDLVKARKYYQMAADRGVKEAKAALKRLSKAK
jgi:TPR repeat protein